MGAGGSSKRKMEDDLNVRLFLQYDVLTVVGLRKNVSNTK